jgi:hypothetical protein
MNKFKRIPRPMERRILLVFILSTLVGIVLVGLGLYYSLERVEVTRTKAILESWANLLARQADDELTFAQQDLELLALCEPDL